MASTHTRSKIAIAKRRDPDADVTELRRKYREERLAEHITEWLDRTPRLTDEQLVRLATLLRNGVRA